MATAAPAEQDTSKRPKDSAFRQQRLPAWQPVFDPKWVIATFLLVGIVFIPIGVAVLVTSNSISEVKVRYDSSCGDKRKAGTVKWNDATPCSTTLSFTVDETLSKPVYLYYQLENFYQNHRRYVSSRDDPQLRGEFRSYADVADNCAPLRSVGDKGGDPSTSNDKVYAPCGLIAWSRFNDSFQLKTASGTTFCDTETPTSVCKKDGIAWKTDVDTKFAAANTQYVYRYGGANAFYAEEPTHPLPNQVDQDFMVWMRTAALPSFRKLFRIIDADIPKGSYELTVTDRFPVQAFEGKKYMVMSTAGWIGGKNPFLGIAYVVVGALSLAFGIIFGLKEVIAPRKEADLQKLLEDHLHGTTPTRPQE